jgi:hypothetical protein
LRVPQALAGQVSACPGCGGQFTVPDAPPEPANQAFEEVEEADTSAADEPKIRCRCPHCNRILRVPQALAGQVSTCPGCGGQFTVPQQMAEAASKPVAWEPPKPRRPKRRRRRPYDGDDYDDYPRKRRRSGSSGASGYWMVLGSIAGLFVVLLIVGLIAPKAGGMLLVLIGFVCIISGRIWFLVVAFTDDVMQGVLCLLCGPYSLIYLLMHWDEAHRPFLVEFLGGVCIGAGAAFLGIR